MTACAKQAESADVRLKKIEEASRAAKKQGVSPAQSEKEAGNVAFKQRQYQKVWHSIGQLHLPDIETCFAFCVEDHLL